MAKQFEVAPQAENAVHAAPLKKQTQGSANYQREKDKEPVRGIFRFHEVPGGRMAFSFKIHKGDPVLNYDLIDGQVYTIPLGVAKHLNKNCAYPIHDYTTDENGKSIFKVSKMVHRCSFQSLEFIDIEELTPDKSIIRVESI